MTIRDQALWAAEEVPGWMSPAELGWLYDQAAAMPIGAVWVEIGYWLGRSLTAVACGAREGVRVVSVENYPSITVGQIGAQLAQRGMDQIKAEGQRNLERCQQLSAAQVDLWVMPSTEAAHLWGPGEVWALFIDGDHSQAAVAEDLGAWLPKVRQEGLVCGHDRFVPGVQAALRQVLGDWDCGPGSIWIRRGHHAQSK